MLQSAAYLSAALLLGRLIGFLREVLLASRLGVSESADIAVVILTLPDYMVALVLVGGFRAALVPALKRQEGADRDALYAHVATRGIAGAVLVALIVAILPETVFALLAPALDPAEAARWANLLRLSALAVPLAAATGVLGAYLNVRGTFFAVGLGTVVYNALVCLAFLVPGSPTTVLWALGLAVLAAAALRSAMLWVLARAPLKPRWRAPAAMEPGFWSRFVAGIGAAGIIYLAQILFRSLAGSAEPGALAVFSYALKLFELPMGLLIAPMATVLLPTLSAADIPSPALLRRGIAAFLGVSLAALAAGWLAGDPIARLIYDRGEMTSEGMADIVRTGKLMFLALPFAALGLLGATLLNAQGRTGVVMMNAAAGLACGAGLAFLGPAFVLPGFVVFHVVHGWLNLWRSGLVSAAKG